MKRRTFLQGAALGGAAVGIGFDTSKARAEMRQFKIARTTETRSTCPYCAVSCGVIIHTLGDKAKNVTPSVVHVEGDPDHWEDISWDDAIQRIARHIKDTRDRTFVAKNAKGQVVNRTPGMAMIGGCTDTNEFNYLQWKFISALGIPYRDSQARV